MGQMKQTKGNTIKYFFKEKKLQKKLESKQMRIFFMVMKENNTKKVMKFVLFLQTSNLNSIYIYI